MKNLHQTLSLEALISMEEEEGLDLNEDDLKKVLILTGSFLNSGSSFLSSLCFSNFSILAKGSFKSEFTTSNRDFIFFCKSCPRIF